MQRKKGIEVKLFLKEYILFFKDKGIFLKSKTDNNHLFIPYDSINMWDGLCLEETFLFKMKYKFLLKASFFSLFIFFIFNLSAFSFFSFFTFFVLTIAAGYVAYVRITHLTIFADYEKIPLKMNSNEEVCYVVSYLNRKIGKPNLRKRILFSFGYKIQDIKRTKEMWKKEMDSVLEGDKK